MKDKDLKRLNTENSNLLEIPISSEHVFGGKLLQVYVDHVELPDGTTSTRDWIRHPGASAVVPVFEDGTIMLLKQFRYPPRKVFLEVPVGKLDPGEPPESTAERELAEESGLACRRLEKAGSFYPAIGYADEIIHVYVAWGLTIRSQNVDDDEFVIPHRLRFSDALKMIGTGEITDAKTIVSLIQAKMWWEKNPPFQVEFD
jgi:ADP-ribose pyrophosphatase